MVIAPFIVVPPLYHIRGEVSMPLLSTAVVPLVHIKPHPYVIGSLE